MNILNFKIDHASLGHINRRLDSLKFTPKKRRWVHGQMARKVRANSRRRITQEVDLNGNKWAPRKDKKIKRKMMRRISKGMLATGTEKSGVVTFRGGKVARKHQEGYREKWNARRAEKRYGRAKYKEPATRIQARKLIRLGFRISKDGHWKPATQKHIMSTMTMGQAGFLIKLLKNTPQEDHWYIEIPARSFLGVTNEEIPELVEVARKATNFLKG